MKNIRICFSTIICLSLLASVASGAVRLKDAAKVRDQREIQLIGYGLVMGLNGTGDGRTTQFTIRTMGNILKRMGIEVPATKMLVSNVAAVMVTATVSPYVKDGSTFDVTVSSMGDAESLEGGTLLLSLLEDNNGNVYGKAQGPVIVGGTSRNMTVPNGIVSNGGILLKELPTLGMDERNMLITLFNPDFTTAYRLATAINESFKTDLAMAQDAGSIIINVPEEYSTRGDMVRFISEIEAITSVPYERARIIINEGTGTIIAGGNVSLGAVAITHGNLSLSISQPAAAPPAAVPGQVPAGERMVTLNESANVTELVRAFNLLGVTPNDLIAIFQALKRSGSLRAELVIM